MTEIFAAVPAVLYLLICFFFGVQLLRFLFPDPQRIYIGIAPKRATLRLLPTVMFYYPAGLIVGLTVITFVTYFTAYVMTPFMPRDMAVLLPANLVTLCVSLYLGCLFWQKRYTKRHTAASGGVPAEASNQRKRLGGHSRAGVRAIPDAKPLFDFKMTPGSIIFFSLCTLFFAITAAFFFYYSYHISNGRLYAGYSVFSDLAPHTAMVSSFAKGLNFPTVYPHFPDGTIRYHFLFYFLCGNLNALGMPIDHAINIPSVLSAVSCFLLLGDLAVLLFGRRSAFLLSPILVMFRSSTAAFEQCADLAGKPGASFSSVFQGILSNSDFIGKTPYDVWGLWANNVYANQRHLLFGMSLALLLLFFFLPHVRRMFLHMHKETGFSAKFRRFFLSREAWLPRKNDPIRPARLAVLAVILVFCMPYFHGSVLISVLLVLAVMAVFSEARLLYLLVAAVGVIASFAQTYFFSGGAGNIVSPAFYWGFVVENPTAAEVGMYILRLTGIALALLLILLFVQRSGYRTVILTAFLVPALLAFLVILTVDITANHKFLQVTLILTDIYIAGLLAFLLSPFSSEKPAVQNRILRGLAVTGTRILSVILLLALTFSGISDTIVYRNKNQNAIELNLSSPVVAWITENTASRSVFLTAPYAMNAFFLSGRFAYFGHPYYAWSAGYDTNKRSAIYADLLTGCKGDIAAFRTLCATEGISYVLVDGDMLNNPDYPVDAAFFAKNLTVAASFPEENQTVIYRVQ